MICREEQGSGLRNERDDRKSFLALQQQVILSRMKDEVFLYFV